MDSERSNEHSVPEVWFEPADPRRFTVLVRRMLLVVLVGVTAAAVASVVAFSQRVAANERFEDRRLAAALAASPPGSHAELAAAAGREALVVSATGSEVSVQVLVSEIVPDTDTERWLETVAGRAAGGRIEQFESIDPSGETWWHTAAPIGDGRVFEIHRRESSAMATARALAVWVAVIWLGLAVGLAVTWWVLRERVERSTETLIEAIEDLRLRGAVRDSLRRELTMMPQTPIELKRLGKSLLAIEVDIGRSFDQIDSLLRAAAVLGASLDPTDVLTSTLEHLEHVLGAERCAILQFDHRRGAFRVLATRGHGESYRAAMLSESHDGSLPSIRAVRERVPVQVPDTESDFVSPSLRRRAREQGYRSVLAVPLPQIIESPTVLILHKTEPYTYSYDEIQLSISFASIAAAALRNAELFARTDEHLAQQSGLLRALVESVDEGLLIEAIDGTVVYANSTMRGLLGSSDGHAAGESAEAFLESVVATAPRRDGAVAALRALDPHGQEWCELELAPPDRSLLTYRVRAFPVTDARESLIGRGLVWTDVTRDRALDQMKSGLLAAVSHEFRTPLALIKGYATTLLADDVSWTDDDRVQFLQLVAAEADRLTKLVQRLLDMRRIDAGMLDLETVPVEVDSLIESAINGVGAMAERIEVGTVPEVLVIVDEMRIVTALRNLIENAGIYSPADTPIHLDVELRDTEVLIHVADHGPGVADTDKATIFGVFVRGDTSLDALQRGTGLGLAIARGFVEAHGGRIWAQDRPGGGSVFTLALACLTNLQLDADEQHGVPVS